MEPQVLDGTEKDTKVFEFVRYRVISEAYSDEDSNVSATVKLKINGQEITEGAQGVGPVHALDNALRKCFKGHFHGLENIRLIDYNVVLVNGEQNTSTSVQVTITFAESNDRPGLWEAEAVSQDIVKASFNALIICYLRIIKDKCSMTLN